MGQGVECTTNREHGMQIAVSVRDDSSALLLDHSILEFPTIWNSSIVARLDGWQAWWWGALGLEHTSGPDIDVPLPLGNM